MKAKMSLLALLTCFFIQCGYGQKKQGAIKAGATGNGVAVIELFTSEGCSSCPPADELMPKLKEIYKDKVIILSFHVDYWNRLGWKDAFSSSEYSDRQGKYAAAFKADGVYTPQAIVNGETGITGSDEAGLQKLISKELAAMQQADIPVSAKKGDGGYITVDYRAPLKDDEIVNIALVQKHGVTDVRSGENRGRKLEHYNVVRVFKTCEKASGTTTILLPDGLPADKFDVIMYIQRTTDMHIIAAKETAIM